LKHILGWCDKISSYARNFAIKSCCPALLSVKKACAACAYRRVVYHVRGNHWNVRQVWHCDKGNKPRPDLLFDLFIGRRFCHWRIEQDISNFCAATWCNNTFIRCVPHLARQKKIFVPRFYSVTRQKESVCPTSIQLKKVCAWPPFAPAPYKIYFAWPLKPTVPGERVRALAAVFVLHGTPRYFQFSQ
jgi:hypothetical protein